MKRILGPAIDSFRTSVLFRWYKFFILDSVAIIRESGFKTFLQKRGWKVIAVVITYYLIRDTFLYILLPYLIAREIL